ncbi:MAG: class I SAM-dependent methyltransferase [bacterium]
MTGGTETAEYDPPRTDCGICGSRRIALHHSDFRGNRIFRCPDCTVQFMNPAYSDRHLARYYSGYAREEPDWDEPLSYGHHFYLSLVEKFSPAKGRLLDVGCGKGHLLLAARERGWDPVGLEISDASARLAAVRTGVRTLCGEIQKIDWGTETFDLVAMHQVLEHLKSPISCLSVVRTLLKDGGILLVVVPNVHARANLVKLALEKVGARRRRVGAYYGTEDHLWYYSPRSLRFLLARLGFEILHMRSGHRVRPGQSRLQRFFTRNLSDRLLWKSTFLAIARKQGVACGRQSSFRAKTR